MADLDMKLDALSIWIQGRQFPAANDFYDANWLVLRALSSAAARQLLLTVRY
jgi:hypothetical protein